MRELVLIVLQAPHGRTETAALTVSLDVDYFLEEVGIATGLVVVGTPDHLEAGGSLGLFKY